MASGAKDGGTTTHVATARLAFSSKMIRFVKEVINLIGVYMK